MSLPNDWYLVTQSSVVPGETTARGLYTKFDIPKGTYLPGCYSGTLVRSKAYSRLIDELDEFAVM